MVLIEGAGQGMGNGFSLTDQEAYLVYKLVSDAITRSTNKTVGVEIGNADAIATAVQLYMRMADAMEGGRFP
jgi:hypothetical protein